MTDKDFIYIADKTQFKSKSGAVPSKNNITFSIKLSRRFFAYNIYIVFSGGIKLRLKLKWKDFDKGYDIYSAVIFIKKAGLIFYHFEIDTFGKYYFAGKGKGLKSKINSKKEFSLLIYDKFSTPNWIKGGIMYQIFVDRFYKGKENPVKPYATIHKSLNENPIYTEDEKGFVNYDFFGGNLDGIKQKLPYLYNLGINCILLSPIFEAFSNHKYDTADYEKIDMMFGSDNDFILLTKQAEKYNIKIIIDGVFNHTGSDSIYFNKYNNYNSIGAYNSINSKYFEWYSFEKYPDVYDSWWGIKTLPAIKKDCTSYQNYIAGQNGILKKWLKLGVYGVRLDVADELNNNFLNKINNCCKKENKENFIIGEVWEDAAEKTAYGQLKEYFWGHQLDSVINYPLREAIIDYVLNKNCTLLGETLKNIWDKYPKNVCHCLMNVIGTHDTARILTMLSGIKLPDSKEENKNIVLNEKQKEKAINNLKIASLIQFTVYGLPCIFYGDERGMEGGLDPFNRKCILWDKCEEEIFNWYIYLKRLRENKVFAKGEFEELYNNNGIYIYCRYNKHIKIIIAINLSLSKFMIKAKGYINLLKNEKNDIINEKNDIFIINPTKCLILSNEIL